MVPDLLSSVGCLTQLLSGQQSTCAFIKCDKLKLTRSLQKFRDDSEHCALRCTFLGLNASSSSSRLCDRQAVPTMCLPLICD